MKLLVTGGAGFIGSHLVRQTIERPEVEHLVNLDCLTYAGQLANLRDVESHPKYAFEQIDLRDKADVVRVVRKHQITHVVHVAAESHVDRSIESPGEFIQTNVVGTYNLLEACRDYWLAEPGLPMVDRRFHHVSTDEVYGSLGTDGAFSETSPYAPNSPYSASKAASDMLVRAWHQTYGLPTVVSHCANNYGPYQYPEKLIPVVIENALARRPIPVFGDGMQVRDWLHVEDHCEAIWQVLTRGRDGESYCVGAGNEWANVRLVELICDLVDELQPSLGGNTTRLIQLVADRPGHDRRYALNSSKIFHELGWRPRHEFRAGLRDTVAWYLENQVWLSGCGENTSEIAANRG
jgi:dTDP-glucose 4,6-dehydratase